MHPKGTPNRTPFSAAERAILQRPGLTERQMAKVIQAELGIRRGAASCGVERRRMNEKGKRTPEARSDVGGPLDPPVVPL